MQLSTLRLWTLGFLCCFFVATPLRADDEYTMDTKQIFQVQTMLLNLGHKKDTLPDGSMTDATRDAIKGWQANVGHPQTGYLSKGEFELLTQTDLSKVDRTWSAVGASTDGTYTEVHGKKLGIEAYSVALRGCKARSSSPEKCLVRGGYGDNGGPWPTIAYHCKHKSGRTTYTHIYVGSYKTYEDGLAKAQARATGDSFNLSNCRTLIAIDGTGKRY